jgi:Ni/Co efflux regulator RcnB
MDVFSFGSCRGQYSLRIDKQGVPPMKRLVLSAVAIAMLAAPVAQAQAGSRHESPRYERYDSQWNKKPGYDKPYVYKKKVMKKHRWARGYKVPAWKRKHVVRDYHRHGLHRPGHGQQWVKVDNDFLLISIASGIIASQY